MDKVRYDIEATARAQELDKDSPKYHKHIGRMLNKQFGQYKVICFNRIINKEYAFICECVSCGVKSVHVGSRLRKGNAKQCDCTVNKKDIVSRDQVATTNYKVLYNQSFISDDHNNPSPQVKLQTLLKKLNLILNAFYDATLEHNNGCVVAKFRPEHVEARKHIDQLAFLWLPIMRDVYGGNCCVKIN